jgi:flagellar assembly factor FliW
MMKLKGIISVLVFLAIVSEAKAVNLWWFGTTSASWNDWHNWSTSSGAYANTSSVTPTASDLVIFTSSHNNNCTIDVSTSVLGVSITSYTGTITQGNFSFTVGTSDYSQASGTFTAASTGLGAMFVCNDGFTISGGTFTGSNSTSLFVLMLVNGDFSQTGGTFTPYKRSTFLGDMTKGSPGTFTHNSGLIGVGGTSTISLLNVTVYDFRVTATSTLPCTLDIAQDLIVANDMEIAGADNPVIINTSAGKKIQVAGDLTSSNTYTVATGGGTGTIQLNGTVAQNITGNGGIAGGYLPNVIIANTTNTVTVAATVGIAGDLTINSGTTMSAGANGIGLQGNWSNSGTFNAGTGTVTFNGSGSQSISGTGSAQSFNHVTVNKPGGTLTAPATMNINAGSASTLTLSAGTFAAGSAINITGDWTKASGATFTPGTGTVSFTGTGAQAINGTSTSQTFNHVVIAKTAGTTLSVGGSTATLTTNNLTETTGNFTAPVTLNINAGTASTLTLSAGTFTAGSAINITGDWTKAIGATFTPGTGTVTFTGTGAQAINGTSTSQTFNHVVIAKTAGTTLSVGGSTATLTTNNLTETTGNFTAPATLNINAGTASTLIISAGTFTAGTAINITGDWTKASGAFFTGGSSTVTFTGTGAQAINGTSTSQTFNHVVIAKTPGTTLSVGGSTTTLRTNNFTETTGNFTAPTTLNIDGASASTLTLSAGTFTAGSAIAITGNWTKAIGATFIPGTGTVTFTGTGAQAINGTSTSQTFNHVVIAKTAGTTLSVGGSTATLTTNNLTETTGNFTAPATLNINAGTASTLTLSAGTFTAGSAINITGDWTKASGATFIPGGSGTVTFTGTGAQAINGTSSSQTFNHLTIAKSAGTTLSVSGGTTTLTTNNLTLTTGNFTAPATLNINAASASKLILSAGTFTAGANINITGDWTKSSGATFTPGSGTVTFTGIGAQAINGTSTSQSFNHVVIAKSAGTTLSVSGSTISLTTNDLTETTGNFTAPATLNINAGTASSLTISAGTFTAGATINIAGNWTDNSTFVCGTGTVKFQGSSGTQTISRSSGSETFYNLFMDRSAGTDRVDFSCPLVISNQLTLTKGILKTTNTSKVTFNDNATVSGGSDLSYIHAAVKKTGDDAFTFPLGDNSLSSGAYHPLAISAPSVSTDAFTAQYFATGQTDGSAIDNMEIDDLSNCEYWNLQRDAGSSDVTVAATWNSISSCMIAADPTQMCLAKWDGSQWKKEGEYLSGTTVISSAVLSVLGHFTLAKKACYVKKLTAPLSISGPTSVCSGAPTVSLVASVTPSSGTYVFSWTAPSSVSGNTYTITPFASGSPVITSYTAKVAYLPLVGCFATKTHTLTVVPGPLVSAGLDQDVALSTPVTLNGAVTGGASPYSYAWTPTTYMTPSAGNVINPSVTLTSATVVIYTLTVTDNNGCTDADETVVSSGQRQFAILKKKMNGGFFLSQNNKLYFKFDGEYVSGTGVNYTVLDETNAAVTGSTSLTNLATSSNAWQYGDNRYELDITSLSTGQYTLEVSNEKNERFYLRFKK